MDKTFCVYILASKRNGTLYIGGNVVIDGNIVKGKANSPGGSIRVQGRASQAELRAVDGALEAIAGAKQRIATLDPFARGNKFFQALDFLQGQPDRQAQLPQVAVRTGYPQVGDADRWRVHAAVLLRFTTLVIGRTRNDNCCGARMGIRCRRLDSNGSVSGPLTPVKPDPVRPEIIP